MTFCGTCRSCVLPTITLSGAVSRALSVVQAEDEFSSDASDSFNSNEDTDRAVLQDGESVDQAATTGNGKSVMMEQKAGSNIWYRASLLGWSQNELKVFFPGAPSCRFAVMRPSRIPCTGATAMICFIALLFKQTMS